MNNWLQYLGFLGLLGLLGIFTPNPGLYGFFGFFGFFGFRKIIFDERLEANVNKACKNTFVLSIIVYALTAVFVSLTTNTRAYIYAFALSFGMQMVVFAFSLQYYEKVGK